MSLGSSPTPCSWGLRQKGHLTWRVLADQQSTNAAGSASIIGIICAHWTGWTYKPLFWSIYRECQRTGAILSLFELLLISSPSHHSLGCWYLAPLDNLSTLTESVIDKVIWNSLATVQQESLWLVGLKPKEVFRSTLRKQPAHGNFPAGYAQPQASHPQILLYNFTEITITTPPLTRILDRLIRGGIILYGDVV
jgi:hypothetical protein